jgi:uncharacterized protein
MDQKPTVVIIHGTGGAPDGNWFPWIQAELGKRGVRCLVPQFPTPEDQSLEAWRSAFTANIGPLTSKHILIGHSVGAAFILNLLSTAQTVVHATFLVAGFCRQLGLPEFDPLNETFVTSSIDWEQVRRASGKLFLYAGSDDPYVPLQRALEVARELQTELIVVPNGGHLNKGAGFITFPRLLRDIDDVLLQRAKI